MGEAEAVPKYLYRIIRCRGWRNSGNESLIDGYENRICTTNRDERKWNVGENQVLLYASG